MKSLTISSVVWIGLVLRKCCDSPYNSANSVNLWYCTHYLSVFNVRKSTRFTPLGIFNDFITSAGKEKYIFSFSQQLRTNRSSKSSLLVFPNQNNNWFYYKYKRHWNLGLRESLIKIGKFFESFLVQYKIFKHFWHKCLSYTTQD